MALRSGGETDSSPAEIIETVQDAKVQVSEMLQILLRAQLQVNQHTA